MDVLGIDEITYGADDLPACKKFFSDWGMTLVQDSDAALVFETQNGCRVIVRRSDDPALPPAIEAGPTLREVVWGVSATDVLERFALRIAGLPGFVNDGQRLGCTDPNGLAVRFQVTRKREIEVECAEMNTWNEKNRINQRSPVYDRATPIEVGHVVFFVKDVQACERFYCEKLRFRAFRSLSGSRRIPALRCRWRSSRHLLAATAGSTFRPQSRGFTVRDIHEVFGGGMNMSRQGWDTQLGPGRHPISSAYFWYFKNPAAA